MSSTNHLEYKCPILETPDFKDPEQVRHMKILNVSETGVPGPPPSELSEVLEIPSPHSCLTQVVALEALPSSPPNFLCTLLFKSH